MPTSHQDSCGPLVSNPFGEKYLYEINRVTFSRVDARTLYRQHFGERLFTPNSLHLIVGSDSGLLLRHLLHIPSGEKSLYLVIEPENVRERLLGENLLPALPDHIRLTNADELKDWLNSPETLGYLVTDAVKLHESFAARDASLSVYRQLAATTEALLKDKVLRLRIDINNRTFYQKQLENISENRHPATFLQGLFTGKTAVILGGGPSLDPLLSWVIDNRDKLVIIAASRIARRLLEVNLIPHIVVSVDQQEVSFNISREMLLLPDEVLFIHSNHAANRLCAMWSGRNLYFGPRYPWVSDNEPENIDPWGPTVTNTALGAVVAMGFARAIVIGVDFCYNHTGMTHAAGSNEADAGPKLDDTVTVDTNDGNKAETSPGYFHAMGYFDEQAQQARKAGCEVISPAPGAARMAAVTYLPAGTIKLSPLDQAPSLQLFSVLPPDTAETRLADGKEVLNELALARTALRKIASLAGEALEYSRRLYQQVDGKPDQGLLQRISKIEGRLEREFSCYSTVAKNYNMPELLKATSTSLDQQQRYLTYFTAYQQGAEDFCALVQAATRRVLARQEEDLPQPDVKKIFAQWREDKQAWRVRVFKQRRPEFVAGLPDGWQKAITTWETNARKWLHERLDGTRPKPVPPRDLSRVRGKALNLFLQQDSAELERLFNGLAQHPDTDQAAQLQALIKGYHCELHDLPDQALECYQLLIGEEVTPISEEALRRIAVVALEQNKLELAQLALECLSNVSFSYQPRYADLLALCGQRQQAADLYTAYLEHVPTDLGVMIKLGKNYRAMGAEDTAQTLFKLVLDQDTGNPTARALLVETPSAKG